MTAIEDPWARPPLERIGAAVRAMRADGWLGDEHPAVLVHDLDRLRARAHELRAHLPPTALHAAAIKANPVIEILRVLVDAGLGLEAASWEEVELARAAGCPPDRIVFDSPAKTRPELREALALGVRLNLDNLDELRRVAELGPPPGAMVGLRFNPGVGAGRIAITNVGTHGGRFGVPWPGSPEPLVAPFEQHPWLTGLHVHVGSQGCGLELLVAAVERALELRAAIHARLGRAQITWVDIGGGLPTDYGPDDAPRIGDYVQQLRRHTPALFDDDLQLVTEFGRALQVGCGFAVSRVEYVRREPEPRLATVHVGADLLLRAAYAPQDWSHELLVLGPDARPRQGPLEPWTIVGPLCFAGDVIARDRPLPPISEGDLLVIRDTGGYTLGMWSRHCSRAIPAVLGLSGATPHLRTLRPRETTRDVVRFWGP
ncbi:type III PLP-dependent enzyme domain-containing protein [Paraliomyxa miuraensis]|uniref:diaminopimelate decarboxylase n=1 Tax=Paraliomyxa miuraensis TaxID=376150 RepID=UPI002255F8C0|nr:diaminopimelate decarboxylase [Paraliomyxa miuraensis]MCX4247490.1 diaminopimelate decarboxylase [Paraliomyxa miuraensis]